MLRIHFSIIFILGFVTFVGRCDELNNVDETLNDDGESEPKDLTLVELDRQGKLQGITLTSRKGRKYFGFLGIPYGKIPERFAISEPADPWDGIKKVQKLPPTCFQFNPCLKQFTGLENCLMLNVYSPKIDGKLPVMVWIYPGGFQMGGARMFEAKYFMDEDVIFITINYRVGALGFLNTGDGLVSGNMGLKDQVLALKWVQENIHKFGGDPESVTIFGSSAGGASVNYHLLSPMSKGLFHRAISQSGSALNPWAFQANPQSNFEKLAENAKCSKDTPQATVQCLKEKEPSGLVNAQLRFSKYSVEFDLTSMKFVPSIEPLEAKGPRFLTDIPYNLMKRGEIANKEVPWISGLNENEGSFYIAPLMAQSKSVAKLNHEWFKMAPNIFYYEDETFPSTRDPVSRKIRDFYFKNTTTINSEVKRNLSNIISDRFFANGVVKAIKLHAVHQKVYPYHLNYKSTNSIIQFAFEGVNGPDGVAHADDNYLMFNKTYEIPTIPELDLETGDGQFSEKLIKLWVSFARDGKPTATWEAQTEWESVQIEDPETPEDSKMTFYELDSVTRVIDDPFTERREFWKGLPLKEHEKWDLVDNKDEL